MGAVDATVMDGGRLAELMPGVAPLVTRARFAELVGLPVGVVDAQCDRGYLPTVKLGKYSLINVEALRRAAALSGREYTL